MSKNSNIIKIIFVINLLIILLYNNISFAALDGITKETLQEACNQLILEQKQSSSNTGGVDKLTVEVLDNIMKLDKNNLPYQDISYNIDNNPTFSYEITINQGISYDEYGELQDKLSNVVMGYLACAKIENVNSSDALLYYGLSPLIQDGEFKLDFSFDSSTYDGYTIIDDTTMDPDVTLSSYDHDHEILVSDFGNRVLEYADYQYKNDFNYSDSPNNTYSLEVKTTEKTDTYRKVKSTLIVNKNGNFSEITPTITNIKNGIENSFSNLQNTVENQTKATEKPAQTSTTTSATTSQAQQATAQKSDNTISQAAVVPKTGKSDTAQKIIIANIILLSIIFIGMVIYDVKKKLHN